MDELVQLVESLYTPNTDPAQVHQAQLQLQAIQRSDHGWEFANHLMATGKAACQFFGALTFKVQINALASERLNSSRSGAIIREEDDEGVAQSLFGSPDKIHDVIRQLLHWLLVLHQTNQQKYVMIKLMSSLATVFIKLPNQWPNCLKSICAVVASGDNSLLCLSTDDSLDFRQILGHMSASQISLVLQFAQTLIEDSDADITPNSVTSNLLDRIHDNSYYTVDLCNFLLESGIGQSSDSDMVIQLLSTMAAWVSFCLHNKIDERPFTPFAATLVSFLKSNNEDIVIKSMETTTLLYSSYSRFFPRSVKEGLFEYLISASQHYTATPDIITSSESQAFCELLLAYAEKSFADFFSASDPSSTKLSQLIPYITSYAQIDEVPIIEDELAMQVLEFWSSLVDEVVSVSLSNTEPVAHFVAQIIEIYWQRIKFPRNAVVSSWTTDSWRKFNSFRNDVCDFLELSYSIVGVQLYELLVNSAVDGITRLDSTVKGSIEYDDTWTTIECSLFCLNGLSAIIGAEGPEFDKIQSVFQSDLWSQLNECSNLRVRQTAVSLIGSYDSFFERPSGQPYLIPTQKYLFDTLSIPELSLIASRSLQKLCQSSRNYLTQLLPSFFDTYYSMSLYSTISTTAHERTVNAMASVIQALPSEERKSEYISQLLESLTHQLAMYVQPQDGNEVDLAGAISLLKCISAIGKGIRAPDDRQILPDETLNSIKSFWASDPCGIRSRIIQLINVFSVTTSPFNQDPEVCDICCDILKCGFSERIANPFVFDYDVVLKYVETKHEFGPSSCFSSLVGLTSCLLTNISVSQFDEETSVTCVYKALSIFFGSTIVANETDFQSGSMQLLGNVLNHFTRYFLNSEWLGVSLQFALTAIGSSDRFVLRDARNFWVHFLTIKLDVPSSEDIYSSALDTIGPPLVSILIMKISGDAARSELDHYTDVLRKLLSVHSLRSKAWFTAALIESPSFSLAKREPKSRSQFLAKLFNLRGSVQTKMVVKDFWLTCRGITDYM